MFHKIAKPLCFNDCSNKTNFAFHSCPAKNYIFLSAMHTFLYPRVYTAFVTITSFLQTTPLPQQLFCIKKRCQNSQIFLLACSDSVSIFNFHAFVYNENYIDYHCLLSSVSRINMASPKEKNRYCSFTASS